MTMDPDVTLEALRRYVQMIDMLNDHYDPDDNKAQEILADLAGELANAAGNLDRWLTNGNYAPKAWSDSL